MGLTEILTIVFIILKLVHVINWSWWWVVSPELIGLFILFLTFAFYGGVSYALDKRK